MKAAQINKYGGSEVIEINPDAPVSEVNKGEVLVEVMAAGLNPVEAAIRSGFMQKFLPLKFPITVGGDFSGVVSKIGKDVTRFKIGDEVFGDANHFNGGTGSVAEFVISRVKNTCLKPKGIDYIQAASLPLAGTSVVQALEEHIKLKKGQKILIHGGGGGIGSLAIQLAKHMGAYIATTVSTADLLFVKNLGADLVIDYKRERFEEILTDFDAVFDTTRSGSVNKSFKILKKGGIIVLMANQHLDKNKEISVIFQQTSADAFKLKRLAELVDAKAIIPQVDKVFPLKEAGLAFEYMETGHPKGKVVVKINELAR